MKIYRRSIKKSTSMYTLKPIVVILALFLLMTIGNLKGFLVFLVIELCVLSFIVACIIAKTKRAEIENEMSKTSLFSLPFFSCIYWDLNNN